MKQFFSAVACIALLSTAACKANYDKTPSGMMYRIVSSKGGAPVKAGQFVKFNVELKLMPKDSVLNTTYGKFPGYGRVDTGRMTEYTFFELLPKCKVGDSVEFSMSIDTLKKRGMIPDYNNLFTRNGQIKGRFTILKTFDSEDQINADAQAETKAYAQKEIADLQNYLDKKGIKAQKTKNGAFVVIETPGDPSIKADSGKTAVVMYKGYLQNGGKVFDTNMDTTKHHTDPIEVAVGQGRVIPAWEEALPYFSKGSKGKIYVPSMLGYGMRGSGNGGEIPPYANLVFDIEVKDVKNTSAEPQGGNGGNSLTPEQMKQRQEQMMQQRQQQMKDSSGAKK